MFSLKNKCSLVTGGASGIGAAIASTFASAGARVFIADRDESGGRRTAEKITAEGWDVRFLHLDITDDREIAAVVDAVGSPLEVLVNNAGVGAVGTILETPTSDLDRLFAINVRGAFLVTKAFLPNMLAQGKGSVINLASIAGVVGVRDRFAYTTTKFALVGMTKALALDHSHTGVRFNAICPCRVKTPFVEHRLAESADAAAALREMESTQLARRMARPDEVASAALYLASDEASMVTGSTLMVDSGWSAGK